MSQLISCPDCRRKLRVPDNLLGKKVKCPGCGVKFAAQVEEEELEELDEIEEPAPPSRRPREEGVQDKPSKSRRREDEEEEEGDDGDAEQQKRKPKKRDIYTGWERVRFGVNLVAMSIWILVCGFGVLFASMIVIGQLTAGAPRAQDFAALVLTIIGGLIGLASLGTQLTGLGFCMGVVSTPRTQTLKALAIAAFSLGIAILLLQVFSFGAARILGPRGGGVVFVGAFWLINLLSVAESLCFLFFMRGVAIVMRRDDLARSIVVFMITIGVIIGLSVIAGVILMMAGMAASLIPSSPAGPPQGVGKNMVGFAIVGCLSMILVVGLTLWLFIRFILLLYQVRSVVDRWLDRN